LQLLQPIDLLIFTAVRFADFCSRSFCWSSAAVRFADLLQPFVLLIFAAV